MEIYLIRHTTPDIAKGVCYGQTDMEVDAALFERELESVKAKLGAGIERFYSSPLKRCTTLCERLNPDFRTDDRLKEMHFGKWEGRLWSEISQEELDPWMQDFVNVCPPEGENYNMLHLRTTGMIRTLLDLPYQKIAAVTHAGNIRSFVSWVLDLPLDQSFRLHLDYGSVVSLRIESDRCLCKLLSLK